VVRRRRADQRPQGTGHDEPAGGQAGPQQRPPGRPHDRSQLGPRRRLGGQIRVQRPDGGDHRDDRDEHADRARDRPGDQRREDPGEQDEDQPPRDQPGVRARRRGEAAAGGVRRSLQ
jgi:hypothetical protein